MNDIRVRVLISIVQNEEVRRLVGLGQDKTFLDCSAELVFCDECDEVCTREYQDNFVEVASFVDGYRLTIHGHNMGTFNDTLDGRCRCLYGAPVCGFRYGDARSARIV